MVTKTNTYCDCCDDWIPYGTDESPQLIISTNKWSDAVKRRVDICESCLKNDHTFKEAVVYATPNGRILRIRNDGWGWVSLMRIHYDESFRNIVKGAANALRKEYEIAQFVNDPFEGLEGV